MGVGRFVPVRLRPAARRLARLIRGRQGRPTVDRSVATDDARSAAASPANASHPSAEELQDYWRNPPDGNVPASYRDRPARSEYLVTLVARHAPTESRILEIGCNVGRNLHYLHEAGYRRLTGIEISEPAVAALRSAYPDSAARAELHIASAEEALPRMADGAFDVVFTMAVLEHIHTTSEWVFDEMRRICSRLLITIEDERSSSWRHFPRDYGAIFGGRGFRELWSEPVPAAVGLPNGFRARVFETQPVGV